jgi:exodeoxyribonuclease-3
LQLVAYRLFSRGVFGRKDVDREIRRFVHLADPLWTFWDYKYGRWPKDKGMRLDHFLLSPKLSERLVDAGVGRWARGQANASDHAPTWIILDL